MKILAAAAVALLLAGCASTPKPEVKRSYTKPAKIVQPTPAEQPVQQIKKRWRYFAIPKWLHK